MLILYATLTPGKSLPSSSLFRFDKLIHLIIFGTFAWLVLRGFYIKITNHKPTSLTGLYLVVGISIIAFGIAIEWMQNYIPDRSADRYDVIANTSGIILAQILFYATHRNN
ncbi:MAG: VanZ family protein [Cytophagales bacterium]|nr:VanZ family protein [Cytophaga sp.]